MSQYLEFIRSIREEADEFVEDGPEHLEERHRREFVRAVLLDLADQYEEGST